jgi:hypothetical protein
VFRASIWGMSAPWTLVIAAALGVVLMTLPGLFDVRGGAADLQHVGGALIVTMAVIAMGEVVRLGRYLLIPLGLLVAVGPWIAGGPPTALVAGSVAGISVCGLAMPRGTQTEDYGTWNRFVH